MESNVVIDQNGKRDAGRNFVIYRWTDGILDFSKLITKIFSHVDWLLLGNKKQSRANNSQLKAPWGNEKANLMSVNSGMINDRCYHKNQFLNFFSAFLVRQPEMRKFQNILMRRKSNELADKLTFNELNLRIISCVSMVAASIDEKLSRRFSSLCLAQRLEAILMRRSKLIFICSISSTPL